MKKKQIKKIQLKKETITRLNKFQLVELKGGIFTLTNRNCNPQEEAKSHGGILKTGCTSKQTDGGYCDSVNVC